MPVEIERKFLVKNGTSRDQVARSERLRDGLVARDDDLKVRVRSYANRTTLCVKSAREGIARDEFEYRFRPIMPPRSSPIVPGAFSKRPGIMSLASPAPGRSMSITGFSKAS